MAKLSVHLVAWNGAKYVPHALASLRAQTFKAWEILVIDNASTDGTTALFEQGLKDFPVPARLIKNTTNVGFAKGHNQGVYIVCHPEPSEGSRDSRDERDSSALPQNDKPEYIQLYNQDIYLAPDYFEKVVAMMDSRPDAGAGQGLILRWRFEEMKNVHNAPQPSLNLRGGEFGLSDVIDTMGLKVMRNRRVVDFRTGEHFDTVISTKRPAGARGEISHGASMQGVRSLDSARDDESGEVEVFGVSGALPIYRRKAIAEVAFEGQMFDEDFFMYKEDVDLAFRLRAAGWRAYVETSARAWHDRTAAGPRKTSDRATLSNRKTKSAFVNYHSYKNHLTVLLKNEHRDNFAKDWPRIVWYEFKKLVYLLCTDFATLKGLREVKKLWWRTMQKRKYIIENYKVTPEEMRKWFT